MSELSSASLWEEFSIYDVVLLYLLRIQKINRSSSQKFVWPTWLFFYSDRTESTNAPQEVRNLHFTFSIVTFGSNLITFKRIKLDTKAGRTRRGCHISATKSLRHKCFAVLLRRFYSEALGDVGINYCWRIFPLEWIVFLTVRAWCEFRSYDCSHTGPGGLHFTFSQISKDAAYIFVINEIWREAHTHARTWARTAQKQGWNRSHVANCGARFKGRGVASSLFPNRALK